MGRIEFDGEGVPIPALALPPFGSESDLPPTTLIFTNNTDFSVSDYRALGFTHFEAWCVGAVGGNGGGTASNLLDYEVVYAVSETMKSVPQSVWNYVIEQAGYDDYFAQRDGYNGNQPGDWRPYPAPVLNRTYSPGEHQGVYPDAGWATDPDNRASAEYRRWSDFIYGAGIPVAFHHKLYETDINFRITAINVWTNWSGTYRQAFEIHYSNHLMKFREVKQVLLQPSNAGMGGGGGGGGFHKTSGVLSDLPDTVPIIVGKAGVNAGFGQVHQHGDWTPDMGIPPTNPLPAGSPLNPGASLVQIQARHAAIETYLTNYVTSYPSPRTTFSNPQKGQDGGASSFAGDVCRASGGEGGNPGMVWDGSKFIIDGNGGDGGLGDRLAAGGGGAGSVSEGVNGSDGIWTPETGIGGGGGGGKGGRAPTGGGGGPGFPPSPAVQHLATAGGQGSYSFADTTVYGQRQFRQALTYNNPQVYSNADYVPYVPGSAPGPWLEGNSTFGPDGKIVEILYNGTVTFVPYTDPNLLVPGAGGGARPFPNMKYGGRGVGYSPDGVVVLRLTKIT